MQVIDKILTKFIDQAGSITSFTIKLPGEEEKKVGRGKAEFSIHIKTKEVYSEVIKKGDLGIGEQYMLGNIDIQGDLLKAIGTFAQILYNDINQPNALQKSLSNLFFKLRPNNRHRSLKNVVHHYDLGNDFYEQWLDKSMTYSCAYFKKETDNLDLAQEQKLEHIARKLMLKKGESLVDIGSGWGSMLIYAAKKYKVKGYGVSLSKEQIEYATKKAKSEGVSDLVKFELKDYRDIEGIFDKFVCIGMFEHVGKDYFDQFFKKVKSILKPEGLGLLHTIGLDRPWAMSAYAWLDKYIFPGGYLPSPMQIFESSTKYGFVPLDFENLRPHYALTLKKWLEKYEVVFDKTAKEKGIEFARLWRLYLATSQVNFEYGDLRLFQLTFSNGTNNNLPLTREHIYVK